MSSDYYDYTLILNYLDGTMSESSLNEFQELLKNDKELQENLEFMRSLQIALNCESTSEEEFSSEDLVTFVTQPEELDDDILKRIKIEISTNKELNDVVKTIQESISDADKCFESKRHNRETNFFSKLLQILFPPALQIRSAISYAAIILLIVIGVNNPEKDATSSLFVLQDSHSLRGGSSEQTILISKNIEIVKLAFVIPVDTTYSYQYELLTTDSTKLFQWYNRIAQTYDTLNLVADELPHGENILRVKEFNMKQQQNQYDFHFTIIREK